jgi:hypothetical protein
MCVLDTDRNHKTEKREEKTEGKSAMRKQTDIVNAHKTCAKKRVRMSNVRAKEKQKIRETWELNRYSW